MSERLFPNSLRQLKIVRNPKLVWVEGAYRFRPKRLVRLCALAWRFLWWADALVAHSEVVETVTYHEIQNDDLYNAILEAIENARMEGRRPALIVMGVNEFCRLTHHIAGLERCLAYDVDPFKMARGKLFGVRLLVCPWIRGWAAI